MTASVPPQTTTSARPVWIMRAAYETASAPEAQALYEDLSPLPERRLEPSDPSMFDAAPAVRDRGAGRPTKKDRRAVDRLNENER